MFKIVRSLVTFIAAFILLIFIALIALMVLVNPNDLKPQITQAVTKVTGRQLQLGGDIQWSLFPWLGLKLNNLQLSNKPKFNSSPFAKIHQLEMQVRLLPLLHKQLEVAKLRINGLTLHLIKNKKGEYNWEGLLFPTSEASFHSNANLNLTNNRFKPSGFIITGLNVQNGRIIFDNQQKNRCVEFNHLQLKSSNLALNKISILSAQFNLEDQSTRLIALFKLGAHLQLSNNNRLIFHQVDLHVLLKKAKGNLPIRIKSGAELNLNEESINVSPLFVQIGSFKFNGKLIGQHLFNNPQLTGILRSSPAPSNLSLQQIQLPFLFKDNLLSIKPIQARFYQGRYQGDMQFDFRKEPYILTHNQFVQINVESLLNNTLNSKSQIKLNGLGSLYVSLNTRGCTEKELKAHLSGKGQFILEKGSIKGIDLSYWVALGKTLIKSGMTPRVNLNRSVTPFDEFSGSFVIHQGVLHNNDLNIRSGRFRVSGEGAINLLNQSIDYTLQAQPTFSNGSPDGTAIPIQIRGTLTQFRVVPVLKRFSIHLIKEKLTGRLNETLKKLDLRNLLGH